MPHCSKPTCPCPASVVLAYDYADRLVVLHDARGVLSPHVYGLCVACAERLRPPKGWKLQDLRSAPRLFAPDRTPPRSVMRPPP